jgi:hypothetical protein
MPASEIYRKNLDHAPSWPRIHMELSMLFADLMDDPIYSERVKHIGELLDDHQFPTKGGQIYFPTQ